ncbi:MAG: thiol reductant ABC exporter subunit CydD [Streptosporangiales bacterium]|nr:thiol reductant ABC exporter subunit CydD [Streptosporangiales bacterium]
MRPLDPRLLRYARTTIGYLGACVATGTATGVLLLVQAALLADVVSAAFLDGADLGDVRGSLIALALAVLARAALSWLQDVTAHAAAARVKSTLRRRLVAHVLELGPGWLTGQRSGGLATLVGRGIDGLDGYLARYLPQLVLACTVPLLVFATLVGADPVSAVIVAVTLPLVPVFMALVGLATQRHSDRRWRALAVLAHHFADVVAGLPTLQVFDRARAQAEGVRRVTDAYRRESLATLRLAFLSALVLELLSMFSVALVAVGVGLRVVEGQLDLATGLLVLLLAPEAYLPLRRVGVHFHASMDGLAAAQRVFEVLETTPARGGAADVPDLRREVVRVEDVTVRYDRGEAVAGASLEVRPGELVALTGPSGCGKSSLLAVLLGFVWPAAGRVTVAGRPLDAYDLGAWRRQLGWVPQRPYLFAGTVADNVRLGAPAADGAAVAEALRLAGIGELAPASEVGEGGLLLSEGQRRRVALARALVRRPALLLLDEPTAGLDADAELAVLRTLRARGTTAVVVTHRPAVLAAADRVVHLPASQAAVPEVVAADPVPAGPADADRGRPLGAVGIAVRLAGALALGVGAAGAGVALLATSGWLISRAAEQPPVLFLLVAIVAVRAFGLARAVLTYAERLLGHDAAFAVLARVRARVYAWLAELGPAQLQRYRLGDLGSRLVDDVDAVLDLLLRAVLPLLTAALVAGGAVVAVAALLPAAGRTLLAAALVAVVAVPLLVGYAQRRAAAAVPPRRAALAAATTELLHGLPDLVAYGGTDTTVADRDARLRAAETRSAWWVGAGAAVVLAATGLASCYALAQGVQAVRAGTLDGTSLAVVALVPLGLADVLGTVPDAVRHGLRSLASLRRLRALPRPAVAGAGRQPAGRPRQPYDVRLTGVTARWADGRPAVLDRLHLTVPAGARVAVTGASGAGKSTLANVLLGQLTPEAGQVTVGGSEVRARRVVGLCAQDAYLFDSTVAENVRLARPSATDGEVRDALAAARLGDWLASLPDGIHTRVGEHGSRVSGGERQRIALARVLLADTPVVILDEPAEHLDEPTAAALVTDLLAATAGRTVLLLTHRLADLDQVDEAYRLAGGRLTRTRPVAHPA